MLRNGGNVARMLRDVGVREGNFPMALRRHHGALGLYAEVLDKIASSAFAGTPVGVVTSLPAWIWRPMISEAGIHDVATSIEGWSKGFSKATAIHRVLAALGVPGGGGVWYVGDMASDGAAAKSAGVSFAWASWGYAEEPPKQSGRELSSFADVLTL
jgi:phosphoglycolate phosphatase-like HAD superfamily hydrolase